MRKKERMDGWMGRGGTTDSEEEYDAEKLLYTIIFLTFCCFYASVSSCRLALGSGGGAGGLI